MLTILHTESSKGWGGQENRTLNESMGLTKLGARVIIACQPDSQLLKRAEEKGIEVRPVVMGNSFDPRAIRAIQKIIRRDGVDVVNTHSGRDSIIAGIAGRLSSVHPVIVRTRHLALPITSKLSYALLPHCIVTVSKYVGQYLTDCGIKSEKVVTIPTGVDLGRFDRDAEKGTLKEELGISPDTPLVGTVAILRVKKGHQVLLEAIPKILKAVPQAEFVFAGDGPQRNNIEKTIAEKELKDKVHLLGLRRDIPNVLKSMDVFVLPTFEEALGTSFAEAMAMGKAVIGSNVGGVPEVINDGVNGYLVTPKDPESIATRVIELLQNPQKAAEMGNKGRQIAHDQFSIEHMCQSMLDLYHTLLNGRD